MGPCNLHKEFIGRNDNEKRDGKRQYQLKDLKGTIGVDASGWFHRAYTPKKGAAVFDMDPKVPLFDAFDKFMSILRSVISTRENGAQDVILFMDGRSHPLKQANEGRRRDERVNMALNDLSNIYEHGDMFGTYDNVKSLRTAIAKRREDFTTMVATECQKIGVYVFCAPFEADWQLIEAQHAGLIDIILSEDGDLFIIGGDEIATDIDYVTGECCLYRRNEILQRESMGSGSYADYLPVLSNLLGNDYIDRLDGNGPVAVRKWMTQFIDADDDTERGLVLDQLKFMKWNKNDQRHAEHYPEKFWKAYYLQLFPPVFRLKPKRRGRRSARGRIDLANEDTYDVVLEPLNELPTGVSRDKWGEMIGFGCDPSTLLQGGAKDLFQFKLMPETGSLPVVLEQPVSEYEPHYKVAHGANPDKRIPIEYWSDWALATFLTERGLRLRGKYNRQNSIRLARRVMSLMNKQRERFTQPREWKEGQQTAYDEEEPLTVSGDEQLFVWNGSWDAFTEVLLEIDTLGDEDFFELFGEGRNGIQVRAQRLLAGGNFDIGKIQTAKCCIKSNGNDAIAIRIECVPSMKSEPYWVMLVVDRTTNKLIPAPTSRCGCPAGLGGCSHLRGEYAILFYLQKQLKQRQVRSETLTQADAISLLPPAMETMKKVPITFNFAFHDNAAESELKREKRRKERNNRNRKKNITGLLSQLNSGDPLGGDDDSDDEDYEDEDDSDGETSYDMDEENLLDFDKEDANVLAEGDTDILAGSGIDEEDKFSRDVKLCDYIENVIGDAVTRASLSESGSALADHKMDPSKVYDHLRDVLDGKGGPNESIQTKLEQLLRQEAMHQSFCSGLMPKNLLSHYLLHTRVQRLVSIRQYKFALMRGLVKTDIKWTAERLGKLLAGYDGLGDRGFAGTSTSYPNCNAMKTPCFMEGRDQYTYGETIGTRDLCQGRYGSEVYNKRTNDYTYLQDKVPRSHFRHLEHALNWATFKANLCQPFLIPRGCQDYFPKDTRHLQKPSKKARANKSVLSQPVAGDDIDSASASVSAERITSKWPLNYIDVAMPIRYFELGLEKVGLLMDGKDCVTDTVRVSSFISRSQYSDKMHCSAARYIMWVIPCGLSVTYTPIFLGRVSEKALVEYWGGSTYNLLHV